VGKEHGLRHTGSISKKTGVHCRHPRVLQQWP